MTKEEVLNTIIEHYKNGSTSALSDYCDRVRCTDCPFDSDICTDEVSNTLIDRLLEAEEHQETNLEHYIYVKYMDDDAFRAFLKPSAVGDFNESGSDDFYKWLLLPYKPPKPKYKMSKFEYDLIQEFSEYIRDAGHCCRSCFKNLQEKGYFKGIPSDVSFKEILDDCEVI